MIVDTSVVYALLDRNDGNHAVTADWYRAGTPTFVTTPLVLAEVDHLAGARAGRSAQDAFRRDLAEGAYDIAWWKAAPRQMAEIAEQYADLGIGLADASLVALAHRLTTNEIATFDERHFRAIRPPTGSAFRLVPRDL